MQTISTKYIQPTNTKGARIIAKSAGAGDKVRAMERGARDISGSILELMRYIETHGLLAARDNNERLDNDQ